MWEKVLKILIVCLLILTGSGCLSVFQPRNEVIERYNFIDLDAPAMRLARPVKAELLEKQGDKWVPIGTGVIPAGAYVKGRAPAKEVGD